MSTSTERIYLADSKKTAREKAGLNGQQHDDTFLEFEEVCRDTYLYHVDLDHEITWTHLSGSSVNKAINLIEAKCQSRGIRWGGGAAERAELIEWKLYQIHRAAQRKESRHNPKS